MKAHFSLKKQLKPILTANTPKRYRDKLYTQYHNSIMVTDIQTFKILKEIPFECIRCFDMIHNYLVVCSADIVMYDLCHDKVADVIRLSRVEVCTVLTVEDNDKKEKEDRGFSVVVGRVDGSVSKIDIDNKKLLWSYKMLNSITHLKIFEDMICSSDGSEFWIYKKGEIVRHVQPNIVGMAFNGQIHTLSEDGMLVRWNKVPEKVPLGIRCNSVIGDETLLYVGSGGLIRVYGYDGVVRYVRHMVDGMGSCNESRIDKPVKGELSMEDESEVDSELLYDGNDGSSCSDDESGSDRKRSKKGQSDMRTISEPEVTAVEDDLVIESMSKDLISTTEQEIFLMDSDFKVNAMIIGNNDEITDLKQWNDVLFVATNSGRLRYTFIDEDEGEYAFNGHVVPAHEEAIMCLSIYKDFLMTTSRDGKSILWRISEDHRGKCNLRENALLDKNVLMTKGTRRIAVERIRTLRNSLSGQNGCVLASSIFVIVGSDQLLQIWDYKDNIVMEKIHNKEINSVEINEERRLIATSSQDKTAKILDFNGRILHVLSGHTKGIWSTCFGKNLIATCSADNTVKLWSMETFTCVGTLVGHRSAVLKGSFYKSDDLLVTGCITGEMKVWNVKKRTCEMNIDVHDDKVWALIAASRLITSGNGSIAFFEDDSAKKASEELAMENIKIEQSIELDKCLRNNLNVKAVEILAKTGDHKSLFRTLVKCYLEKPVEIFDVFEDKQKMLFEVILKQGTFKNGVVVHWLLKEALKRNWKTTDDVMDKIHNIVTRHSNAIDEMYSDLLGFSIFERSI